VDFFTVVSEENCSAFRLVAAAKYIIDEAHVLVLGVAAKHSILGIFFIVAVNLAVTSQTNTVHVADRT
jgi:hypothetical protein